MVEEDRKRARLEVNSMLKLPNSSNNILKELISPVEGKNSQLNKKEYICEFNMNK